MVVSKGRGYVYGIEYHIVFCTKYRKKILTDSVKDSLFQIIILLSQEMDFKIIEINTDLDHIHLLISCKPQHYIPTIVKRLKGTSARLLFKLYPELKKELSKKDIDNEKYASLVSKLFIIDFYTLSNKSNINDVGSVQFVYSSFRTDFVDLARAGIYKQVKSNLDNDRSQDLPEVKSVTIDSIEEIVPSTELKSDDFKNVTEANAYQVKVSWTYTKKNNFQTSATMLIVKDGDKLSVAKLD